MSCPKKSENRKKCKKMPPQKIIKIYWIRRKCENSWKKPKIIRGGQWFSQVFWTCKNTLRTRPQKTKKKQKKCFKNEQNYVKIRKTYFRQKTNRNIRHSLVWARAARKKAKNTKMAKIRKPDFSRAPPTPSVGDGQAIASLRNVMHWAPLRGGPSGEGGLRPHVRFFPLFPPFTLVNPF